jgi:hypothetical protein
MYVRTEGFARRLDPEVQLLLGGDTGLRGSTSTWPTRL